MTGKSTLELPVRPPRKEDRTPPKFKPVEAAPPFAKTALSRGYRNRVVHTDMGTGVTVVQVDDDSGRNRYDDIDLEAQARSTERYSVCEDDPLAATAEVTWSWVFERKDWKIRTESRTHMSCTKRDFILHASLTAYEGESKVFERTVRRNHSAQWQLTCVAAFELRLFCCWLLSALPRGRKLPHKPTPRSR